MDIVLTDSGYGGTAVLKECIKLMPEHDFVYIADEKNAPYGNKSKRKLIKIADELVKKIIADCNPKIIVFACNTLTAAAISEMRGKYKICFIGTQPAIKPALTDEKTRDSLENRNFQFGHVVATQSYGSFLKKSSKISHLRLLAPLPNKILARFYWGPQSCKLPSLKNRAFQGSDGLFDQSEFFNNHKLQKRKKSPSKLKMPNKFLCHAETDLHDGQSKDLSPSKQKMKNEKILIFATKTTLHYTKKHIKSCVKKYGNGQKVKGFFYKNLAKIIDDNIENLDAILPVLKKITNNKKFRNADKIVLGCTHFILIKKQLKKVLKKEVMFFDGAKGVAKRVKFMAEKLEIKKGSGSVEHATTKLTN